MLRRLLITAVLLTLSAGGAGAQTASDSTSLLHHDSTAVLRLTNRGVLMEFTELGVERQRHRADSTAARYGSTHLAIMSREIVGGLLKGMKFEYPFSSIQSIEARGATVVVMFPPTGSANDNSFTFDGDDPAAARAFVAKVQARMR